MQVPTRLTKAAEWINAWAGVVALLTAFFTWVGLQLQFMQPYGWPEAVFLGVGTTCVALLLLTGSLALYRFFRPLQPTAVATTNTVPPVKAPPDYYDDLQAIRATLDGVASTVTIQGLHLRDLGSQEHAEEAAHILQDLTQKVGIQTEDFRRLSLDYLHSLLFVTSQATLLLLDDLIRLAPQPLTEDAWSEESRGAALDYLQKVKNPLGGTDRMQMLTSSLELAAHDAEQAIEHAEQPLPGGANPIVFRRWAIAHTQAQAAVEFLKRERARVTQEMVGQRHNLVEILHRRNPP